MARTRTDFLDTYGTMALVFLFTFAITLMHLYRTEPHASGVPSVVWQLTYESESGDEYVLDTLDNIGDCWDAMHARTNRRGLSCERTRIEPR